jgi:hypothetical protein
MLTRRSLVLFFGAILLSQAAWCGPLIYARQLPTAGVNAADAERSNWTWYDSSYPTVGVSYYSERWLQGDGFTLPSNTSGQWVIDTIVTYSVASLTVPLAEYGAANFGAEFSSVALYTGIGDPSYAGMSMLTAGAINPSGSNSNPNITHERVFYYADENYLDALGSYAPLWKTTFGNLNWTVDAGVEYYFAVDGAPRAPYGGGTYGLWYNHFTNYDFAAVGDQADGADSQYWIFYNSELPSAAGSRYLQTSVDAPYGVDVNVEIYGVEAQVIPEPGSVFLVALGGLFLIARRAKRRLV